MALTLIDQGPASDGHKLPTRRLYRTTSPEPETKFASTLFIAQLVSVIIHGLDRIEQSMEAIRKRSVVNFVIWVFASTDLYVLSSVNHMTGARLAAFVAVFLSVISFVLAYRSNGTTPTMRL